MSKVLILLFSILICATSEAKLLDRIVAVIDDKIITLSMTERIKKNLEIRKNIAPFIYEKTQLSSDEIAEKIINIKIRRDKLAEFGYVISDDQVDSSVKNRVKQLNLSKDALIQFLEQNHMNYDEYFELTREAMEYSIFVDRVVVPLISITEQEIKNTYYKRNLSNKTLSFKYDLIDFYLSKDVILKEDLNKLPNILTTFQNTGNLPARYKNIETNTLGELTEDGLTPELKNLLKHTDEGAFSKPYLLGNDYHVFFVKKKDLVESDDFVAQKRAIRAELMQEATNNMTDIWMKRQMASHYIKIYK